MWCTKCDRDLAVCICLDIDERLSSLSGSPHLALTFCKNCRKYHARCRCGNFQPMVAEPGPLL
jgi:hypothetical protein